MSLTIAIAGKGGTGKTTIAALLIELLSEKGIVLAIDGDPSTNLHLSLGLPLTETVGAVREEMAAAVKSGGLSPGISKQDYLELKINQALVGSNRVDLLAMGRPEGPGCYCAANHMLRSCIDRLGKNYDYVVIDCEAGMEHISRQTTRDVDILLLVSDPTIKGIVTAGRIKELVGELRTQAAMVCLVVNRVAGDLPPLIMKTIEESGLELIGIIPEDPGVKALEAREASITQLSPSSAIRLGVKGIAERLALVSD